MKTALKINEKFEWSRINSPVALQMLSLIVNNMSSLIGQKEKRKMTNETAEIKVGTKVYCNGYPGTVIELTNYGMIVVRLERGETCVSKESVTIISES